MFFILIFYFSVFCIPFNKLSIVSTRNNSITSLIVLRSHYNTCMSNISTYTFHTTYIPFLNCAVLRSSNKPCIIRAELSTSDESLVFFVGHKALFIPYVPFLNCIIHRGRDYFFFILNISDKLYCVFMSSISMNAFSCFAIPFFNNSIN
ncbi:hypothetical protein SDC9_76541 [bioreactor metagenome]|uniref:Uncharacterized protein n=1 Tax=bioreactor metagenome TaxID=1076179 RepID=A0A644YNW4_9ZZZZ